MLSKGRGEVYWEGVAIGWSLKPHQGWSSSLTGESEWSALSYLSIDGDPRSVVLSWLKGTGLLLITKLKSENRKHIEYTPTKLMIQCIQYKMGKMKLTTDPYVGCWKHGIRGYVNHAALPRQVTKKSSAMVKHQRMFVALKTTARAVVERCCVNLPLFY